VYSALIPSIVQQPVGCCTIDVLSQVQVPEHEVSIEVSSYPGALHTVKLDQRNTYPGRQIAAAITFLTVTNRILLATTFFIYNV